MTGEYLVIAILFVLVIYLVIVNSLKDIKSERLLIESNSLLDYVDELKRELAEYKQTPEVVTEPKKKATRTKKAY